MKKRSLILLIILVRFFPIFGYATTDSISIKCDSNILVAGDSTSCVVSGNSSGVVTAVSASLNASNITFVSFTPSSKWVGDDISNGKIDVYTADDISGNFEIGTLKIKVNDNIYNVNDTIILDSVIFYDDNYNSNDIDSVSFDINVPAFVINKLKVNEDKKIIKLFEEGLKIQNLFDNIYTSGNVTAISRDNTLLDSSNLIKTSDKLKISFDDNSYEYLISLKGDVTGNGKIENADSLKIADYLLDNTQIAGDVYLDAADYNDDDKINLKDAIKIVNKALENN